MAQRHTNSHAVRRLQTPFSKILHNEEIFAEKCANAETVAECRADARAVVRVVLRAEGLQKNGSDAEMS